MAGFASMRELIKHAEGKTVTLPADQVLALVSGCFLSLNGVDLQENEDWELSLKIRESAEDALRHIGIPRLSANLTVGGILQFLTQKYKFIELRASK